MLSQAAWAQLPAARLTSVFPPGGKQGATIEVIVAGTDLDGASKLHFSHPGITAEPKTTPPGPFDKEPQPVANTFVVKIAGNVPVGQYDVRAVGKFGISTPRAFAVSGLEESAEKEPNNTAAQATEVAINATVNGQSGGATDIDYLKFTAKKGQRLILDCWSQRIDSRMDATLAVYDQSGNELATSRDVNRRDPLIDFTAPADGPYTVKIWDFTYGGGADFYYRLVISTGPYVDFVLPNSAVAGSKGKFTLYGRNLPGGTKAEGFSIEGRPLEKLTVDITAPSGPEAQKLAFSGLVESEASGLDGFEYRFQGPNGTSNPVLIGYATASVVTEQEPNNQPKAAHKITLPCEYVGHFQATGDRDWIEFAAKKGEVYWIEILSQRHGFPADPRALLQKVTVNDKGEETVNDVQELDDFTTNLGGLSYDTRCDDPVYRFAVPDDATYRILVADLYQRGNPRYVYRLSIRTEAPDFRLVAVPVFPNPQQNQTSPWTTLVRQGGNASVQVVAFRRDGFTGDIEISAEGLPPGVTCAATSIGSAQNAAHLVFRAADDAAAWAGAVKIVGKARIGDSEVVREARGGTVLYPGAQNNQPAVSRMAREVVLAVCSEPAPYTVRLAEDKVFEATQGGKLEVPLKAIRRGDFKGNLTLAPVGLPQNVRVANITINGNATDGKAAIDIPNNAPVGIYSFHLIASSQVQYRRNAEVAAAAEEAKKELDKLVAELTAAAKDSDKAKAEAEKAATEAAAAAKKAADEAKAKQGGEEAEGAAKAAAEAAEKAKAAEEAKAKAVKAAAEAAEKVKAATDAQKAAVKKATDTANAAKQANVNNFEPSSSITVKITAPAKK
jgi:hypothetical protein